MGLYNSAGVYIRERDLSAILVTESATVAALVGVFKKGPSAKPVLVTSVKMLRELFGDPDASISFASYCAINFFEKGGQQLFIKRQVHSDATYGAAVYKADKTLRTDTVADPLSLSWSTLNGGSGTASLAVYDVGQGSLSAQKSFQLLSRNVLAPTVSSALSTGGSLAASVHNYLVVAKNGSLVSGLTTLSTTQTPGSPNFTVTLTWNWDTVATSYDIYQQIVSGSYKKMATVGLSSMIASTQSFSYVDDGSVTADASTTVTLPIAAVTEAAFQFVLYDTSIYANSPVEIYDVTWLDNVNGDGVQTQIEERVNSRSRRINVTMNPTQDFSNFPVYNTVRTALAAGASGTAPTSSDIATGWDSFADPEAITARVFINAGYSNTVVQSKMLQVAATRGDAFCILDAPIGAQVQDNPYAYTDYRRLTLNANTNRGAIYGPDILYADVINGKTLYVPPSGYVAGVFAFTDFTRNPSYQPAGLQRGQLPNALGTRVRYKQADRDILGPAQCNPIVNFPGEGIVPWEGLTLQAEQSGFSFISIRRIFDTIEVAIKKFLKPEVHDPNDDFTQRAIKSALEEYLNFWVTQNAIKSFKVVLDGSINPGYLTTLGQLNVNVMIEPIYPVRFIECTIGLTKAGANFDFLVAGNALA